MFELHWFHTTKKASHKRDLIFGGGEGGMALLCTALACPPKSFVFRYRTAHQLAKNDYQSFSSRALPPRGSNPLLIFTTKERLSTKVDNRSFLAEKDYASQIASFFSQYQLLLKWYFIGVERLKICYTLTMYHFNKKGVSVSLCNIKSITPNITPTNRLHIRSRTP